MAIVISTRPIDDANIDAAVLAQDGITCLAAPMMEIKPLQIDLETLWDKIEADAVALTSRHVVSLMAATKWAQLPVLCVGESTARLARDAGIKSVIPGPGDGQGLADMIAASTPYKSIFWPSAVDVGFDLAKPLEACGITLHRTPVYKAATTPSIPDDVMTALINGEVTAVMVHSGRAGAHLVTLLENAGLKDIMANIDVVAVSSRVAGHCGDGWRKLNIASSPRRSAMFEAIKKIMNGDQK